MLPRRLPASARIDNPAAILVSPYPEEQAAERSGQYRCGDQNAELRIIQAKLGLG